MDENDGAAADVSVGAGACEEEDGRGAKMGDGTAAEKDAGMEEEVNADEEAAVDAEAGLDEDRRVGGADTECGTAEDAKAEK